MKNYQINIAAQNKIVENVTSENSELKDQLEEIKLKLITTQKELESVKSSEKNLREEIEDLKSQLKEERKPPKTDLEVMKDRAHEFLYSSYQRQPMQTIKDRIELPGMY